jgi:hypothetical protein
MDDLAMIAGFVVLLAGFSLLAKYLTSAMPERFKILSETAGLTGFFAVPLCISGWVWMGYALAHRTMLSTIETMVILLLLWGGLIAAIVSREKPMDSASSGNDSKPLSPSSSHS